MTWHIKESRPSTLRVSAVQKSTRMPKKFKSQENEQFLAKFNSHIEPVECTNAGLYKI